LQCNDSKQIKLNWGKLHNFPFFSIHIFENKEILSIHKKVSIAELEDSAENWSLREFSLRLPDSKGVHISSGNI
jgi:hypothetical protein